MTDRGAHFYRCDVQVHTPRDAIWNGARPVSDEDRNAWATGFVTACRQKGLNAIAVTDHHDFTMIPLIRKAAEVEVGSDGTLIPPEERLVVFPGLELTLSVPCQALLILDADFPVDKLDLVLTHLAIPIVDPGRPSLPAVTPISHVLLSQLYERLNESAWLRDHYIVLPNVTDGGHKTLLRSGNGPKTKKCPVWAAT